MVRCLPVLLTAASVAAPARAGHLLVVARAYCCPPPLYLVRLFITWFYFQAVVARGLWGSCSVGTLLRSRLQLLPFPPTVPCSGFHSAVAWRGAVAPASLASLPPPLPVALGTAGDERKAGWLRSRS